MLSSKYLSGYMSLSGVFTGRVPTPHLPASQPAVTAASGDLGPFSCPQEHQDFSQGLETHVLVPSNTKGSNQGKKSLLLLPRPSPVPAGPSACLPPSQVTPGPQTQSPAPSRATVPACLHALGHLHLHCPYVTCRQTGAVGQVLDGVLDGDPGCPIYWSAGLP